MSRPDTLPEWATDTNFAAGSEDWSATPTKVEPSAGKKATGQVPESAFPAPEYNWLLNNFSEWIDFLDRERTALIIHDHFTGSAIGTETWNGGTGSTDNDSAAGAHGALELDGGSTEGVTSQSFAFGTSDFHFAARLRTTGIGATSAIRIGITGASGDLYFFLDGASSTANWRTFIDTVSTAAGGTPASVSTTYQTFEITRKSNVVTFSVDGVTHHSIGSYTTNLDDANVEMSAGVAGVARIDWIRLSIY
jgi:hypothetical protein